MRAWQRIGVVGAGNMGSGIAQKIATEGFPVVMVDLSDEAAARGLARVKSVLEEGVQRRLFSAPQVAGILERFVTGSRFELLAGCDLVIEAVYEDRAAKAEVFARAAAVVSRQTILATNTSSFRVDDLAAGIPDPDRFLGLHYFYHPAKNRLVEVIPGSRTSAEAFADAWRFQEIIGKTPIKSADAPGFIVNRFFVPWINEAVRMLDEGVADIPTIEAAAKRAFGIGMGPFELMNVTGIPIALHAATTLGEELGRFYAPSRRLAAQVESKTPWSLEGASDPSKEGRVARRLEAVTFFVAAELVSEGVGSKEDTDIGARVGLRWQRGPFELMNARGVAEAARAARELTATYDDLDVPALLVDQAATGRPFTLELVDCTISGDGIATVRINRPDALNALNPEVMRQLAERFDAAVANPDVKAIVLAGSGKAFVAGADVKFFVERIDAHAVADIEEFTRFGQALFERIDHCPKRVICKLDGISLGGGSELALAADVIVATERGSLAFPETGIGIYPGLGGTARLTRRIGAPLARWLVYTGQTVDAATALDIGLVDHVAEAATLDERIRSVARGEPEMTRMMGLARFRPLIDLFGKHRVSDLVALAPDSVGAEQASVIKRLKHKAPVALRIAERCIDIAEKQGTAQGLAAELAGLQEIFATADAREGLSSVLEGRRPTFKGA